MGVELGVQVAPIPKNTELKADDYMASAAQKYKKGEYRGSLADLDRAIQLNPNLAIAYYNRASIKEDELRDIQGALADLNRAIQLDPNNALALSYIRCRSNNLKNGNRLTKILVFKQI